MIVPAAGAADIQEQIGKLESQVAATQLNADIAWIMVASSLVLSMQVGFLFLEAGLARSKHSINVALKNAVDFMIAAAMFWVVGFGLMFGASVAGLIGEPQWFGPSSAEPRTLAFFVFQTMFVGTAATIVSGAIAERMSFSGYLVMTAAISLLVYPIFGHWAWGNGLIETNASWLAQKGFIDFAGSTVVHSIGGWLSLAGVIMLGARIGRFDSEGRAQPMHGHSTTLAAAGAMILFVGWIGFNAGSTLKASPDIAKIAMNTVMAGAAAGCAALLIGRAMDGVWQASRALNGLLAGLVGVTAGCAVVEPAGAVAIGIACAVLAMAAEEIILHKLKLDDVVGAVSVHGLGGMAGTLLVAAFAAPDKLVNGSRIDQLIVQATGAGAAFAWAFGCGLIIFKLLDIIGIGRVSEEAELQGLNAAEHGATLGTGILQAQLHAIIATDKDLRRRLDERAGDETAEIAAILNPFIAEMQDMLSAVGAQAGNVSATASQLAAASQGSLSRAEQLASSTDAMHQASDRMTDKLGDLATISGTMETTSQDVVSATRQMSTAMDQVTQLLDSLVTSVNEVAGSAEKGTVISSSAGALVSAAHDAMQSLTAATREIEDITALIESFAEKTNLLALNATIEAARAGDAGRGFSVVAAEVKQLAHDTTRATDEIRRKVALVRSSGDTTGDTVERVKDIFATLDNTMAAIAGAATNQHRIMSEVAGETRGTFDNVRDVAKSTDWMHENIRSLTEMTTDMAKDAARVDAESSATHGHAQDSLVGAREIAGAAGALDDVSKRLIVAARRYRT